MNYIDNSCIGEDKIIMEVGREPTAKCHTVFSAEKTTGRSSAVLTNPYGGIIQIGDCPVAAQGPAQGAPAVRAVMVA